MKVTFLFGAGASRHALPIISEIPERLKSFIEKMKSADLILDEGKFEGFNTKDNKKEIQNLLINDLEWLLDLSSRHASVDTAAKKLFIKGNYGGLTRLKVALSIFFVYEQLSNKPDYRYDAFFASLLQDGITSFPDNIRIISWNYDYQFELSYQEYSGDKRISSNQSMLNVVTKFDYSKRASNRFKICKLNGTTGIFKDRGFHQYTYIDEFDRKLDKSLMENFVRNYAAAVYFSNQFYPSLSFAWERQNSETDIVTFATKEVTDTETLVVIGYSFPFFNREIDRSIIGSMTNLKSVYFQSPDAESIIDRFQSIRTDIDKLKLKPVHDVYQFFLPYEL
jgi:hypothetical protein